MNETKHTAIDPRDLLTMKAEEFSALLHSHDDLTQIQKWALLPADAQAQILIAENAANFEANAANLKKIDRLTRDNAAMLEALKEARRAMNHHGISGDPAQFAVDAAISQAESESQSTQPPKLFFPAGY